MDMVNDKFSKSSKTLIHITIKGKEALENYSSLISESKYTRVMSVIALAISLGSLTVSIIALFKQ